MSGYAAAGPRAREAASLLEIKANQYVSKYLVQLFNGPGGKLFTMIAGGNLANMFMRSFGIWFYILPRNNPLYHCGWKLQSKIVKHFSGPCQLAEDDILVPPYPVIDIL